MSALEVAVVGSGGFVGSAVVEALSAAGHRVRRVAAPRLLEAGTSPGGLLLRAGHLLEAGKVALDLRGCQVVVNAAGLAAPGSHDWPALAGANALLPAVLALCSEAHGVGRLVHLSSTAVQGRRPVLDETARYAAFSPYSRSKQLGEQVLLLWSPGPGRIVVLRPGSVHGHSRETTRALVRFAGSRLTSVAGSGRQPTPQALVESVAATVAHLVEAPDPPALVLQPWAGMTAAGVLRELGGREPHHIPRPLALALTGGARVLGAVVPGGRAQARRLELLWFGQRQAKGYLDATGFRTPSPVGGWSGLSASDLAESAG